MCLVLAKRQTPREWGTQSYGSHEIAELPTSKMRQNEKTQAAEMRLPSYRTSGSVVFVMGGKSEKLMIRNQRRGFMFLGTVLMITFAGAVAGLTVLYVASTQARIGEFHRTHGGAEAAAEAGLVMVMDQLRTSPNLNYAQGVNDLTVGAYNVDVYNDPPNCPCAPGTQRTLHAKVTY